MPSSIDCNLRDSLPDLTFNFEGRNVTITPYDYTMVWRYPGGPTRCITAIFSTYPTEPGETEEIILGSAFLRAAYTVFDLDSRTIGCKCHRRLLWHSELIIMVQTLPVARLS